MEHRTVFEGKHLRVKACGRWEYVQRNKAAAGVVIVAVTPEDKLLLVEQYRVPMKTRVIELPAGLAGDLHDPHEAFLAAAQRELMEETGYEAAEWRECPGGPPSAGLSNETVFFFLARHLRKTGKGGGEESEDIHVYEIPLYSLPQWLDEKSKTGLWVDPKIYCGLYFLEHSRSRA